MSQPRLLTVMGSGETAPTMVKVHRFVVDSLRGSLDAEVAPTGARSNRGSPVSEVKGLLLDTPFGFQTNAVEIASRAASYFRESVGTTLEVAGMRSSTDLEGASGDRILAQIAELPLVFSGPGSPSYALRQWRGTLVPSLIAEKLNLGGAVTFASAAALTLGSATVPVYEVYKVGENPHWIEGLDLLRGLGFPAVVIPHYDNAEGQTHDTRYCYLGEERLSIMEEELDEETFVLGVDEHTALVAELGSGSVTVMGHGGLTVRVRSRSERVEAGETTTLIALVELAERLRSDKGTTGTATSDAAREGGLAQPVQATGSPGAPAASQTDEASQITSTRAAGRPEAAPGGFASPLLQSVRAIEAEFRSARQDLDAPRMVQAILDLEAELWAWRADTLQSDEMDRGRASLRSMIGELGSLSVAGTRDRAEVIGPYVELALAIREDARRERRFAESDDLRERLELLGVTVNDTPEGSTWELQDEKN